MEPGQTSIDDIFRKAHGPPQETPRGNKLHIVVPAVIFLLILLVGWIALIPPRSYPEAGKQAGRYLLTAGQQNFRRAWGMMSDGFKQRMTYADFENSCIGDPHHWVVDAVEVQGFESGDGGAVIVTVLATSHYDESTRKFPVKLAMIEEAGQWKVDGLEF